MNKNNKDTKDLINEMLNQLDGKKPKKVKRELTLEAMVFPEEGEDDYSEFDEEEIDDEGSPFGSQEMQQQPQMQQMPQGGQQQQPVEPTAFDEDPEIAELLNQIRLTTLKGLEKLAQNPMSAQYDLLKKIFLLIDKSVDQKKNNMAGGN